VPTATFTADFRKWNEALRNAQTSLKPLEVSAKGVQQQLQRMATSLSGADIIKQANLATAAVKSIGGATKLTEAEQKKLNATVTEAIAKYAALGQKAPADMLALAKATKQSESAFSGIASALGPIKGLIAGAFAVGAITKLAGDALQFASDLNDLSAKTGISTKALQEFKFAGDQVGVTLDDVSTAVLAMQKHLVGGDKSAVSGLKSIGLTLRDLKGLRPEDQFNKIAEQLAKIEDPAVRNRTAFDLMGKAAANVLPLIASDLKGAREEAEKLGLVLDQETINQLDNLGDTWAKIKLAGEALVAKVLVPMVPAIQGVLNLVLPLVGAFGSLAKAPYQAAKAIFELQRKLAELRGDSEGQLAAGLGKFFIDQELKKLDAAITQVIPPMKELGETTGDTGKKMQDLRDQISGAALVSDLRDLKRAWDSLTPAQKTNAIAIGEVVERYQKLAEKLPRLPNDLKSFAQAMNTAADATGRMDLKIGELKPLIETLGRSADLTGKQFRDWGFDVGFEATIPVINLGKALKETGGYIDRLPESLEKSAKAADGFGKAFQNIAESIPNIIIQGILNGASAEDTIKAIGTKVGAELGGAIGEAIGGPIGKAIGEAVGSALGPLLDKLIKTRAEQITESVRKDFGVGITEQVGQQIENRAKNEFGGSRQAAQIGSLSDIISAGGGVTTANLDKLQARLHDVFSLLQTGEFTASQGQKVLNDNFQTFVDFLGGRVNPALKEIIRLNDEFGTQSKAIAQYVDAQANSALTALTKVITARGTLVDQLSKAKPGSSEAKKLQAQLDATPLTKGGAQAEGAALFGIFERLTKDGASAIDVLKQLDPVIESLDKQLAKAGLSGGAAFDQIKKLAGIATDEIAGPAFEAIQAYGQALEGLNNSGVLTQEEFAGLSEQITATYQAAVDALVKQGKDGSEALHLISPQLQEIWELQQDFGYAVDESTQKLLDQAVAAGDVGEKHRSIQAQTLDVMKHLDDVLTAIGEKFGVYLPDQAKDGVDGINNALDKIKVPDIEVPDLHVKVHYDLPEGAPTGPNGGPVLFAKGGPVYAAGGYFAPKGSDTIPAMLTPGEFVVSRRGVQAAGMPALQSINSGMAPSGGGNMTTVNVYVNNKLDHAESQKIAAAIAPHLPGVVANGGATQGKWKRMTKAMAK